MTDVKKLIADFDLYFTSANSIDVDARISVPRDEWRALKTAIAQRLEADDKLQTAAQAVIAQWDSPKWDWHKLGPTADLIAELNNALPKRPQ